MCSLPINKWKTSCAVVVNKLPVLIRRHLERSIAHSRGKPVFIPQFPGHVCSCNVSDSSFFHVIITEPTQARGI